MAGNGELWQRNGELWQRNAKIHPHTPVRRNSPRQICLYTPVPRKTIPAKAGISQLCAAKGGVIKAAMPPCEE